MKKLIFVVTMLTLVAFFSAGVMAAEQKPASTPAKTAPAPKMEKASGAIAKIDEMAKTFDVKEKVKGKEKILTFATDESTKITKAGKAMTFADLKQGMRVYTEYKVEIGKNIAVAIKIAAPKAAPKTTSK